jgi:hypothetical protein
MPAQAGIQWIRLVPDLRRDDGSGCRDDSVAGTAVVIGTAVVVGTAVVIGTAVVVGTTVVVWDDSDCRDDGNAVPGWRTAGYGSEIARLLLE